MSYTTVGSGTQALLAFWRLFIEVLWKMENFYIPESNAAILNTEGGPIVYGAEETSCVKQKKKHTHNHADRHCL